MSVIADTWLAADSFKPVAAVSDSSPSPHDSAVALETILCLAWEAAVHIGSDVGRGRSSPNWQQAIGRKSSGGTDDIPNKPGNY